MLDQTKNMQGATFNHLRLTMPELRMNVGASMIDGLIFNLDNGRGQSARWAIEELPVLDLFCGVGTSGLEMADRVFQRGGRRYIGIDIGAAPFDSANSDREPCKVLRTLKRSPMNGTVASLIPGDVFKLLSSVPRQSVNVLMNMVDDTIIQEEAEVIRLAESIHKVVARGGFAMGYLSRPLAVLARRHPQCYTNKSVGDVTFLCRTRGG